MERICVHSPHKHALEPQPQQGAHAPVGKLDLQIANHVGNVDTRVEMMPPADWLTTFCAISNAAMTMFQVFVTISTTQRS